jgi:hypothetical protein
VQLGRWRGETNRALVREFREKERVLADSDRREVFLASLRDVETCAPALRHVDEPPSRFWPAMKLFERSCTQFEQAVAAERRALDGDVYAIDKATAGWELGYQAFVEGGRALSDAMLESAKLPRLAGATTVSRIEPRFSAVASRVARHPAEVACWSRRDWPRLVAEANAWNGSKLTRELAGFAFEAGSRLHLDPAVCEPLVGLTYRHARPQRGDAFDGVSFAVMTLAHEAEHLDAPGTEKQIECAALQRAAGVARSLGVAPRYARRLVEYYWREIYPTRPAAYAAAECRNGGRLDENPASDVWP